MGIHQTGLIDPTEDVIEDVAATLEALLDKNYGDTVYVRVRRVADELAEDVVSQKVYTAIVELADSPRRGLDIECINAEASSALTRWQVRRREGDA